MSLLIQINEEIKNAMKAKQTQKLDALRAVKSALLLAQTESGAKEELSKDDEIKLLQKLIKQRKESARIYQQQGREDLANTELEQASTIEQFLPKQLSTSEIEQIIEQIISESKENGIAQMGDIMRIATQRMMGQADGKTISDIVREKLA
ncbi:MAG: GatB/YqeY domain-containing protein [Bacteroidota bacterium]|nr:GatB/YqeY domain-containing protein [Bacteroidota bacterium]